MIIIIAIYCGGFIAGYAIRAYMSHRRRLRYKRSRWPRSRHSTAWA